MDLGLIRRRLENNFYRHFEAVQADLELVVTTCGLWHGAESAITVSARELIDWLLQFATPDATESLSTGEQLFPHQVDDDAPETGDSTVEANDVAQHSSTSGAKHAGGTENTHTSPTCLVETEADSTDTTGAVLTETSTVAAEQAQVEPLPLLESAVPRTAVTTAPGSAHPAAAVVPAISLTAPAAPMPQ